MNANLDRLSQSLLTMLAKDPRVVVLGEDVAQASALGLTQEVSQREDLRSRLLPTPLCTTSLLAHAGGLALGGKHPIVILSGVGDLLDGLSGLREMGLYNWMGGDTRSCPMIVVVPVGPGMDAHDDPNCCPESLAASLPGVDCMTVGTGESIPGLLPSAIAQIEASERPLVLLVPRKLLLSAAPEASSTEELSSIAVHKFGSEATVFCWGASVSPTLAATAKHEDVSVIELHQLSPIDKDAVLAHAQQSGRILIVHAGGPELGLGAELAAYLSDEAILHLDAPLRRITGPAGRLHPSQSESALPSPQEIAQGIEEILHY